jgi:enoyl-CoA hydratase/carnithine racemase
MNDVLLRQNRAGVLLLTLNRPDQMNALSIDLVAALHGSVLRASQDPAVRVIVITGAGRAFCAGADLIEAATASGDPAAFRGQLYAWRAAFLAITQSPKPVIAATNGVTLAGGLELALACDFIVASDRARLGDGHITYGLVPGGGGSARLTDAVGSRWARWLMYTGELLEARRAREIGLVHEVFPADSFIDDTMAFASAIARRSARALGFMKRMSRPRMVTDDGLDLEIESAVLVVGDVDAQEGLAAFAAKREPNFGP